jgi:hypothetical protein
VLPLERFDKEGSRYLNDAFSPYGLVYLNRGSKSGDSSERPCSQWLEPGGGPALSLVQPAHKSGAGELALFATVAIQPKGASWAASAR